MTSRTNILESLKSASPAAFASPLLDFFDQAPCHRRGFLKSTLALAAGGTAASGIVLSMPQIGRANPLLWVARAAFSAALGWFVGRVLDRITANRVTQVEYRYTTAPAPSTRNAFHDSYGSPHLCTHNVNWVASPTYNNFDVRLNGYFWMTPARDQYWLSDYSGLELVFMQDWNVVLVPRTYRLAVANVNWRRAEEIMDAGGLNPREYRPAFQRTWDDANTGRARQSVAVAQAGNPQIGRLIAWDA